MKSFTDFEKYTVLRVWYNNRGLIDFLGRVAVNRFGVRLVVKIGIFTID